MIFQNVSVVKFHNTAQASYNTIDQFPHGASQETRPTSLTKPASPILLWNAAFVLCVLRSRHTRQIASLPCVFCLLCEASKACRQAVFSGWSCTLKGFFVLNTEVYKLGARPLGCSAPNLASCLVCLACFVCFALLTKQAKQSKAKQAHKWASPNFVKIRLSQLLCVRSTYGFLLSTFLILNLSIGQANAYPIFAQQNYTNPREANGRIVCANCHLAQKPVEIEVPQAILPDTVFEAVIKIPYDKQITQVLGNGKKGGLNVGTVVILPSGFSLAPEDRISESLKNKVGDVVYQPYSDDKANILVVGPLPGKKYSEMVVPLLSPDPTKNKSVSFLKYPIYLGANRGRGQVYPDGSKSNNTIYNASASGKVVKLEKINKKGALEITIEKSNGDQTIEKIPPGPTLLVKEGQIVSADQPLTNNPNVGGFGQEETEIVLQNPARIQGLIVFFVFVVLTQLFLVFKKKQFEKVQLAEMNF